MRLPSIGWLVALAWLRHRRTRPARWTWWHALGVAVIAVILVLIMQAVIK